MKFGATVTLIDEDTGDKKAVWQIVGEPEADAKRGASRSPRRSRAPRRQDEGSHVEVVTPGGAKAFAVKKVEWR